MSDIHPSASLISLTTPASVDIVTPTASTANLVPKNDTSSTPASASTINNSVSSPKPSSPPPTKDYEAAFAALSASYGFLGGGPAISAMTRRSKGKKGKKDQDKRGKVTHSSSTSTVSPTDNGEAP